MIWRTIYNAYCNSCRRNNRDLAAVSPVMVRFSMGFKVLMHEDAQKLSGQWMLVPAWCRESLETTLKKREAGLGRKAVCSDYVVFCFYPNWHGGQGRGQEQGRGRGQGEVSFKKSFKVKNASLIGHFYLASVPLIVSVSFMRSPIGKEAASTSGKDRRLCAPHFL